MSVAATNLERTFNQNHDALLGLLGSEEFDPIEFHHLIAKRDQIVEEILKTSLPLEQLQSIHTKHQLLENQFVETRDGLKRQLKRMDSGKKALKAYR